MGEGMDQRIMLVVLGAAALALAGLPFAAGGHGWNETGASPQDWNGTFGGRGMMRGLELNGTHIAPPNMTAMKEAKDKFDQAVLSGDYPAAKNLSATYGFGGPIFGKLNSTTFAKYSQIANLESQLRQELGLNGTVTAMPVGMGQGKFMQGFMEGRHLGFEQGMRNKNRSGKQTTTSQQ